MQDMDNLDNKLITIEEEIRIGNGKSLLDYASYFLSKKEEFDTYNFKDDSVFFNSYTTSDQDEHILKLKIRYQRIETEEEKNRRIKEMEFKEKMRLRKEEKEINKCKELLAKYGDRISTTNSDSPGSIINGVR